MLRFNPQYQKNNMKIVLGGINRLDTIGEKISEHEDISIENIQHDIKRERDLGNMISTSAHWGSILSCQIHGIPYILESQKAAGIRVGDQQTNIFFK